MTTPVQQLGPAVLIQGAAVDDTRRILAQSLRWAHRDGIRPPTRIGELLTALEAASAAGHPFVQVSDDRGHADAHQDAEVSASPHAHDHIGTAEAAAILRRSTRQVRRLASSLDGWRSPSGEWLFARADVEAYRNEQRQDHVR